MCNLCFHIHQKKAVSSTEWGIFFPRHFNSFLCLSELWERNFCTENQPTREQVQQQLSAFLINLMMRVLLFSFCQILCHDLDVRRKREREDKLGRLRLNRESKCDGKQLMKGDDGGVTFHKYGTK